MKHAPIRHRFEFLVYLAAKRLLLGMSNTSTRKFGLALGSLGHSLDRRHRKVARDNLELVMPELSDQQRRQIVAKCYRNFGAAFCEAVSAARFGPDEVARLFDIEGWEHYEAAKEMGRGVLLLCGHYGSWQMGVYPLGLRLGGLHMVVRPPDNPHIDRDLEATRGLCNNSVVPRGGGGHRVLNIIRRKGNVGMVIDQRVPPDTGIVVPFMGHPARTTPVPAFIATRTGAPAVPTVCRPISGGRYRLSLGPAILPEGKGPEAVAALTCRYLQCIEHDIRQQPELWLWLHRRWRL